MASDVVCTTAMVLPLKGGMASNMVYTAAMVLSLKGGMASDVVVYTATNGGEWGGHGRYGQ